MYPVNIFPPGSPGFTCLPEDGMKYGPFFFNGAFYALVLHVTQAITNSQLWASRTVISKSTDNGVTWVEKDVANSRIVSTTESGDGGGFSLIFKNGIFDFVYYDADPTGSFTQNSALKHSSFDCSTDTYGPITGSGPIINLVGSAGGNQSTIFMGKLSTGDLILIYVNKDNLTISWAKFSGGAFSNIDSLVVPPDGSGLIQFPGPLIVDPFDRVHIPYVNGSQSTLLYRSWIAGVISGPTTIDTPTGGMVTDPPSGAGVYLVPTDEIIWPIVDIDTGGGVHRRLAVARGTPSVAPVFTVQVIITPFPDSDVFDSGPPFLLSNSAGTNLYILWSDLVTGVAPRVMLASKIGAGAWSGGSILYDNSLIPLPFPNDGSSLLDNIISSISAIWISDAPDLAILFGLEDGNSDPFEDVYFFLNNNPPPRGPTAKFRVTVLKPHSVFAGDV